MRRTCSRINKFIEVNAKKFASRPALGVDLYFSNTVSYTIILFYTIMNTIIILLEGFPFFSWTDERC